MVVLARTFLGGGGVFKGQDELVHYSEHFWLDYGLVTVTAVVYP